MTIIIGGLSSTCFLGTFTLGCWAWNLDSSVLQICWFSSVGLQLSFKRQQREGAERTYSQGWIKWAWAGLDVVQIRASSHAVWSGRQRILQVHCTVGCCLADSNHSELSLCLQLVRAELKGGQRESSVTSQAPEYLHDKSQTHLIVVPRYVEQNKSYSALTCIHLSLMCIIIWGLFEIASNQHNIWSYVNCTIWKCNYSYSY